MRSTHIKFTVAPPKSYKNFCNNREILTKYIQPQTHKPTNTLQNQTLHFCALAWLYPLILHEDPHHRTMPVFTKKTLAKRLDN